MKVKNFLSFGFAFLALFGTIIGFSSYAIFEAKNTDEDITHSDETTTFYDVNVHYETLDDGLVLDTEYYIPKEYTISHGLTDVDANGNNYGKDVMAAPNNGSLTGDGDPIQIYYDVYNGTRTKINRRNNSLGPEQIKSFSCDVTSWTQVEDETSYEVVWQTNVTKSDGTEDYLHFQSDSGNSMTHGVMFDVGAVYLGDQIVGQHTEKISDGVYVTELIYQRITIYKSEERPYGQIGDGCAAIGYSTWVYYPQYEVRMVKITRTTDTPYYVDSIDVVKVKENSLITPIDLNIPNYRNYGYYKDPEFSEYFDFTKPIVNSSDIYLRFIQSSAPLAASITNVTSGNSLSFYDIYRIGSGDGNDDKNVGEDNSYHIETNSVFIDEATIQSGATINFTYGAEEIYISPNTGSISEGLGNHRSTNDYAIAPDYTGTSPLSYCGYDQASLYIILNGDLTINGTLNIGAQIGGRSSSTFYSYIIGRYAFLDLHGHNIIINDGGVLNNYGLIKDTIGGGQIIVNPGGKVTSTVTIADARGRDQSAVGLSKRQSLFTEYNLSYLQVPCKFYKGSSLVGYAKVDFQELGIVNCWIGFIGNSLNGALFSFRSDSLESDYILYEPYKIASLSNPSTSTIYTKMYNQRSRFTFHANVQEAGSYLISASLTVSGITVNTDFDFARIDFPISPLMDFVLDSGYTLELYSKMTFYPGSGLYTKNGSTLSFKYVGYKTFEDVGAASLTISGESRYIAGGLMSYTTNIRNPANYNYSGNRFGVGVYAQTSYWNYVKPNNIAIEGDLLFDTSIDTTHEDGRYFISGKMSMSESAISSLIENRNVLHTYDVKAELYGGFLYNSSSQSLSGQYEKATSFNLNPLILNDVSYLLDDTHNLKGTFDTSNGIFTSNEKMYYLHMDNDLYSEGSDGDHQGNTVDRAITIKEIDYADVNAKIIRDIDSNKYVYYCGIYVPILDARYQIGDTIGNGYNLHVNLRKFHSNRDNATYVGNNLVRYSYDITNESYVAQSAESGVKLSPLYDNGLIYYSTSTKEWTFRGFIK